MNCPDGQKLSLDQKCDVQDSCPVNKWSFSAISSSCSAPGNVHCPQGEDFSKVCHVDSSNDKAGKNRKNSYEFAKQHCGPWNAKPCKPSSHVPFYYQCYSNT